MHSKPAKYLILIPSDGGMVARLFDADRKHQSDFDASSEEVAVMTRGLVPTHEGSSAVWAQALGGHNAAERAAARVYTLDV